MEGNSSPYIQYQHARANTLLRRAEEQGIAVDPTQEVALAGQQEVDLVKHLAKFSEAIKKAIDGNQPSTVAEYTYHTADLFSKFYNNSQILKESDPKRRNTQLRLAKAAAQVIKNGLNLLGIAAPTRM
jgi:arginyl-tRNA synthetase